jgi:hypothetical protein
MKLKLNRQLIKYIDYDSEHTNSNNDKRGFMDGWNSVDITNQSKYNC